MVEGRQHHLVVAGGGSGGHVFPALPIAEELRARGWWVSWIGRPAGIECDLVGARGIPYFGVPASPMTGRSPLAAAGALAALARSAFRAALHLRRVGATVLLGTGGYASAAGVLGAVLARRPVALLEPNAVAGSANRQLSRFAKVAAVGTPGGVGLACPEVETGVPVRYEFHQIPDLMCGPSRRLLVLGGSQGAEMLNRLLPQAVAAARRAVPALQVMHQVGSAHLESTAAAYRAAGSESGVALVPFLADVAEEMASSDLIVSRAGAVTLAEVAAAGRPSILVPLTLAGGHQGLNAERLGAAGAAEVFDSGTGEAEEFAALLTRLLADGRRLEEMGRAARRLARPRATRDAAALVEGVEDGS